MINFFQKAIDWEKHKGTINLQEDQEGVFLFEKSGHHGILMEGTKEDLVTDKVKRIVGSVPFKGYSLVLSSILITG